MPEGPEIRRAADRVAQAIAGHPITSVFFAFPRLQPYASELEALRVTRVDTHGKAMVTWFGDEGGDALAVYSHNQLYGRWMTRKTAKPPKTGRSLRFAIHTEAGSAYLYSASEIDVLRPEAVPDHPFLAKLGPDPLHRGVGAGRVAAQLDRFPRRQLAALLLDQRFVAGLGNYLRSEILFEARVRPERRPRDLEPDEHARLAKAVVVMMRRAYRQAGVTTTAAVVRAAKARGTSRRAYRHYVFGRPGRACRVCGTRIEKHVLAGRRLYLCPHCQR